MLEKLIDFYNMMLMKSSEDKDNPREFTRRHVKLFSQSSIYLKLGKYSTPKEYEAERKSVLNYQFGKYR